MDLLLRGAVGQQQGWRWVTQETQSLPIPPRNAGVPWVPKQSTRSWGALTHGQIMSQHVQMMHFQSKGLEKYLWQGQPKAARWTMCFRPGILVFFQCVVSTIESSNIVVCPFFMLSSQTWINPHMSSEEVSISSWGTEMVQLVER